MLNMKQVSAHTVIGQPLVLLLLLFLTAAPAARAELGKSVTLTGQYAGNVHEVNVPILPGETQIDLNLQPYLDQILQDMGTTRSELKSNLTFYFRWYLEDANGNYVMAKEGQLSCLKPIESIKSNRGVGRAFVYYNNTDGSRNYDLCWHAVKTPGNAHYRDFDHFETRVATLQALYEPTDKTHRVVCALTSKGPGYDTGRYPFDKFRLTSENVAFESKIVFNLVETKALKHTSGYAKNYAAGALGSNGQQQVHAWTYDYYLQPGQQMMLGVPVAAAEGGGSDLEPAAYWRWYDYNTDRSSVQISNATKGRALNEMRDADGTAYGLFKRSLRGGDVRSNGNYSCRPNNDNVSAVTFTAPNDENWTGDAIACDVSRYNDWEVETAGGTDYFREPTLSLRYIYNIRPARVMAEDIKAALLRNEMTTFENNGYISIGLLNQKGYISLRLNQTSPDRYFFYPYTDRFQNSAVESDFDTSQLIQATKVSWRAIRVVNGQNYYREIASSFNECKIRLEMNSLVGEYKPVSGSGSSVNINATDIKEGVSYFIVVYAEGNGHSSPIANFNCYFINASAPQPVGSSDSHRTIDYLEDNYTRAGLISFDDMAGMDLSKPTVSFKNGDAAASNSWDIPLAWEQASYSFAYPGLQNNMYCGADIFQVGFGLSPFHGDYVLIKSMNMSGVSNSNTTNNYYWWHAGSEVDDYTHSTDASKYGYYLYVDASDEPRPLASVPFSAKLCSGSELIISADVNSLTYSGLTSPQLMFKIYGVKLDAANNIVERQLIHSFASGDFASVIANYKEGVWYQVYARTFIHPTANVENYQDFVVTIDNYSRDTQGNDFGIDNIRFYTRNRKIEVNQRNGPELDCDNRDNAARLKLRISIATIRTLMNMTANSGKGKPLYYRICNADGSKALPEGDTPYFVAWMTSEDKDNKQIETDAEGNTYFRLTLAEDSTFALAAGKSYFVSAALPVAQPDGSFQPGEWGSASNICSVYGDLFTVTKQSLVITGSNGAVTATFTAECGATAAKVEMKAQIEVPNAVHSGTIKLDYPLDWYFGYRTAKIPDDLKAAVTRFRVAWPDRQYTVADLPAAKGDFTAADRELLLSFLRGNDTGILFLRHSNALSHTFPIEASADKYLYLTVLPAEGTITVKDNAESYTYKICPDAMSRTLTLTHDGPQLYLGMTQVDYPAEWGGSARTVRVMKAQLDDMAARGTGIVLPVKGYRDADGNTSGTGRNPLRIRKLRLVSTTDPTAQASVGRDIDQPTGDVTPATATLTLKPGDFPYHEGYEYELELRYIDASKTGDEVACDGVTTFRLQVVPAYVTWTGGQSTNWNNDRNWRRANKAELLDNGYKDYGTDEPYAGLQQAPDEKNAEAPTIFVPMRGTRVVVPNGVVSPYLNNYTIDARQGIIASLYGVDLSPATDNINYALMVEMAPEASGDYACEPFYANTCKEIYFRAEAEIRAQHYLDYEKARVDFETTPNAWGLWASPLRSVYAGDFYLPANGRQETKAFADITFDAYNRTAYPVYQRSWNKAGSMVITSAGDGLRDDYDASVSYGAVPEGDTLAVVSQWSHAYNDVAVPYAPGHGFAVRAGRSEQAYGQPALFRLPKADTEYAYFAHDNATPAGGERPSAIDRNGEDGVLAVSQSGLDITSRNGQYEVSVDADEVRKGYLLVGNPYMASLDMAAFFDANPGLYRKYWRVDGDQVTAYGADEKEDLGRVRPMTGFFVKPKVAGASGAMKVTFTPAMASTTYYAITKAPANRLRLTVSAGGATATATVIATDKADNGFAETEDVETIFDTNLEGRPAVYTIAGQVAASINRMADLSNVPLGISYGGSDAVTLAVDGVGTLSAPLYLYDARTGRTAALTDGARVTVVPNAAGRYFLTSKAVGQRGVQTALRCYSQQAGEVVAATSPDDRLTEIAVYDTAGRLQRVWNPGVATTTFALRAGIYLITLNTEAVPEGRTFKVIVK